ACEAGSPRVRTVDRRMRAGEDESAAAQQRFHVLEVARTNGGALARAFRGVPGHDGVEHRTHASSWPRGRPLVLAAIHTAWPIAVSKVRPSIPKSLKFTQVSSSKLRSEEHTSELQSRENLVCRLLLEKKKNTSNVYY